MLDDGHVPASVEIPGLVEDVVGGQQDLPGGGQLPATSEECAGVVEPRTHLLMGLGVAHEHPQRMQGGIGSQGGEGVDVSLNEIPIIEEVTCRISGDRLLWHQQQRGTGVHRLCAELTDAFDVAGKGTHS